MNPVFESGVSVGSAFQTLAHSLAFLRVGLLCVSPARKEFSEEVTAIYNAVSHLSRRFDNSFQKEFL